MKHDETIIMPKNYTTLTEEEMTYLDGGVRFESKWWGGNLYLNHRETQLVCTGVRGINMLPIPSYVKAILKGYSAVFRFKDKGRGIKIRITSLYPAYPTAGVTGVWSQ